MRVDYPVNIGGVIVNISQECAKDTDAFEFVCHMNELYGNMTCTRKVVVDGKDIYKKSTNVVPKVRISGEKKHKYYELVCMDRDEDLKYAKRGLGVKEEGNDNMFPQRKWGKGHANAGEWIPNNGWSKYNETTKVED